MLVLRVLKSSYSTMLNVAMFCIVIGTSCLTACAQNNDQKPASPTREAQAETILRASIAKLGGLRSWTDMKGLRAAGSVQDGETKSEVAWEDHWSGHYKMVRHKKTGEQDLKYLQNPDRHASTSQGGSVQLRKMQPEFDPLSTLITHAPGAAIALAINNPRYGLVVTHPQIKHGQDMDCLRITKAAAVVLGSPTNVTLCLSHDGMPTTAMIELTNVKDSSRRLFERVDYGGYTNVQGQLFPTSIELTSPLGPALRYNFQSFVFNPILDREDFEEKAK